MAHTLKKTAVIGLGGTGMHAVLYMKKKLLERYGEIPPMFKFLVIDTTDKDLLETDSGEITVEAGEYLKLEVRDPVNLIKTNREVKDWLPDNIPPVALSSGARQVRALGRLAVFANANQLDAKISGLIGGIRDFKIGRTDKYEIFSDNVVVNVVCSLSGGTGSGCVLDTAVIVRSMLSSLDKLIGYFLLPDIFTGKPATDNVEPNAYGAMKEINYFFRSEARLKYVLGGRSRSVDGPLFDAVYLVNKTNRQGIEYSGLNDLKEFLGMGMLLQASATGKGTSDILDNLQGLLFQNRWFNQPTVYSSFGVSEVVYPGDWYADLFAKKIALSTLQKVFLGCVQNNITEYTDDFIRRVNVREHDADDVIDSLASADDVRQFPLPQEVKKEQLASLFGRKDPHLNDVQRTVRDAALANVAKLKTEKVGLLDAEVAGHLAKPQGLNFARNFVSALIGRITEFRQEMNGEKDAFDTQRAELSGRYPAVQEEATAAAKAMFGSKGKIDAAVRRFKQVIDREATLIFEIERRDRAIDFFAHLLNEASAWRDRFDALATYCQTLVEELNLDVARMQRTRRDTKPFVYELKPANLTEQEPVADGTDFMRWLTEERRTTAEAMSSLRLGDFKNLLLDYGYSNPCVKEIKNKRIDEILAALPEEQRMHHLRQLDTMASPLWQYDQGLISGDKHTENIYLFGVEDKDNTVLTKAEIALAIASPYEPALVSTGDAKRVLCFKVEACVPAFVVSNFPRYREKYLDPNRPFPYHLHRDWEKDLPDLFPSDEEEGRKYWSLALADPFSRVVKRGEYYYVRSEKRGERTKDCLIKLAQGRREAMRAFLEDGELVEETREAIDKVNGQLGNNQVKETLEKYGHDLEEKGGKQTEEVRQQIELELQDIENYLKSLVSL
jgi:hypothetical protein